MKALALCQPWASLIAEGAKRIETRGWATKHRGPILIYAAKGLGGLPGGGGEPELRAMCAQSPFLHALVPTLSAEDGWESQLECGAKIAKGLPRGAIVARAELSGIMETDHMKVILWAAGRHDEIEFGNYEPGRFAWQLDNVKAVEPMRIPKRAVTCFQGLFDVPDGIASDLIARA